MRLSPARRQMTSYVYHCVTCGTRLRVDERHIGRTLRCPSCGTEFVARPEADRDSERQTPTPDTAHFPPPAVASCPSCGVQLKLRPEHLGRKLRCPRCRAIFDIPGGGPREALGETPSDQPQQRHPPQPEPGPESIPGKVADEEVKIRSYSHICSTCGARLEIHGRYFGRSLRCTGCGAEFTADPATESSVSVQLDSEEAGIPAASEPDRRVKSGWVIATVLIVVVVTGLLWWLGTDRRNGFAGELFTVRKAKADLGELRRSDAGPLVVALDRETVEQLVVALKQSDTAEIERLGESPRCLVVAPGTRIRVLERRKREVETRVRILDGPWSSRIVWVPVQWIR